MANPKNTSTRLKYCKSHSTAPDVKRRKKGGKEEGKEGRKEGRREGRKAGRKEGRRHSVFLDAYLFHIILTWVHIKQGS